MTISTLALLSLLAALAPVRAANVILVLQTHEGGQDWQRLLVLRYQGQSKQFSFAGGLSTYSTRMGRPYEQVSFNALKLYDSADDYDKESGEEGTDTAGLEDCAKLDEKVRKTLEVDDHLALEIPSECRPIVRINDCNYDFNGAIDFVMVPKRKFDNANYLMDKLAVVGYLGKKVEKHHEIPEDLDSLGFKKCDNAQKPISKLGLVDRRTLKGYGSAVTFPGPPDDAKAVKDRVGESDNNAWFGFLTDDQKRAYVFWTYPAGPAKDVGVELTVLQNGVPLGWGQVKVTKEGYADTTELPVKVLCEVNSVTVRNVPFTKGAAAAGYEVDFLCKPARLVL